MQMSARVLGQHYGLTAEEMNRVLVKLGFLKGAPGEYTPTDKALEYVIEKDHHRGCGGYSFYNRYWQTRTFDDSIKDVIQVSDELKAEVRAELAAAREARRAARLLEQAVREADKCAKEAAAEQAIEDAIIRKETLIRVEVGCLVLVGALFAGVMIYKGVKWIKHKKSEKKNDCEEIRP